VELGPDNPGGKLTWSLPASGGPYACCTLQFQLEAIGGNVSVISMVINDTGDGDLICGSGIKCNVYEDIGDCAAKYDASDDKVSADIAWDDTRTITITFSSPIELENLVRRTFIICYLVSPPDYSPDPAYYQSVIPVEQIDAEESGTFLKVPTDPATGNITGQQIAFKPV